MDCLDIYINNTHPRSRNCGSGTEGFTSLIDSITCWIENGQIDTGSTVMTFVDNSDGTGSILVDGTILATVITTATDVVLTDNGNGTSNLVVNGTSLGTVTNGITNTSSLINDGEDGSSPYATISDIQGVTLTDNNDGTFSYVDATGAIITIDNKIATVLDNTDGTYTIKDDFGNIVTIDANHTSVVLSDNGDGTSSILVDGVSIGNTVNSVAVIPVYTLSPISGTNTIDLLKDGVSVSQIDLTPYLDDTNLARLVSGVLNPTTNVLTVTRDDNTTFDIDLTGLDFVLDNAVANSTNATGVVFNGTGQKVATFNGDIDVTGTIDPDGILYTTLADIPTAQAHFTGKGYDFTKITWINATDGHFYRGTVDLELQLVTSVNGQTGSIVLGSTDIAVTPIGNITSTDVGGALNELQGDIDVLNLNSHADDDVEMVTGTAVDVTDPRNPVINLQTATDVAVTPTGNLVATNVQEALVELQTEVDGTVQGVTGSIVDNTDPNNPVINETVTGLTNTDAVLNYAKEDGAIDNVNYGSPWLANNTDKPFIDGVDTGDIYAPKNVFFDGKTTGISVDDKSITFGKTVDTHNGWETSYGYEAGENSAGNFNNFYGYFAGKNFVGAGSNAYGFTSLFNAEGLQISAYGHSSGKNAIGNDLSAFGYFAGNASTGVRNSFFGRSSGYTMTGSLNTGVGNRALDDSASNQASALGDFALYQNTFNNVTGLGAGTIATKNNQVVLGNAAVVEVFTNGAIVTNSSVTATSFITSSDSRLKTIGQVIKKEKINGNVVNIYEFTYTVNGEKSIGYVAQELEVALVGLPQSVIDLIVIKKEDLDINATIKAINTKFNTTFTVLNDALMSQEIKDATTLQSIRDNGFPSIGLTDAIAEHESLQTLETRTTSQQDRLDRFNLVNWFPDILKENKVIATDIRSIDLNKLNFFK